MRRNSNGSFFWNSSIVTKKPRYIYAITWNPHQRIVLTLLGNLSWFVLPFPGRWWSDDNSDVSTSYVTQILWEATGTLDLWEFSLTGVTREIRGHRCDRCEPDLVAHSRHSTTPSVPPSGFCRFTQSHHCIHFHRFPPSFIHFFEIYGDFRHFPDFSDFSFFKRATRKKKHGETVDKIQSSF